MTAEDHIARLAEVLELPPGADGYQIEAAVLEWIDAFMVTDAERIRFAARLADTLVVKTATHADLDAVAAAPDPALRWLKMR